MLAIAFGLFYFHFLSFLNNVLSDDQCKNYMPDDELNELIFHLAIQTPDGYNKRPKDCFHVWLILNIQADEKNIFFLSLFD